MARSLVLLAHDGRSVEHPAGRMLYRFSSQNPDSIYVQPPPPTNYRKAFMAYH